MKTVKLTLALAALVAPSLQAASAASEKPSEKDTKGAAQTALVKYVDAPLPEDRAAFVQGMANMTPPADVTAMAQAWLAANSEVVTAALGNEPLVNVRPLHEKTWAALVAAGSPNYFGTMDPKAPKANYVFRPFKNWIIKIAGQANRRANLHSLASLPCAQAFAQADWDKILKMQNACDEQGYPITHQTTGRVMAHWLLNKAITDNAATHVQAPEKGLVHIPGRPTRVCDKNYVVLARENENLKPIDQLSMIERAQMEEVIKAMGLCLIDKTNVLRDSKTGKIVPCDLELRNCWTPLCFPYRKGADRFEFRNDVRDGLVNLAQAFPAQAAAQTAAAASAAIAVASKK